MELSANTYIIAIGFLVWVIIAPPANSPRYGELFLAYMVSLLFCLIGSSEIMMTKPVAFYFTVGGALAFFYVVARKTIRISIKK